MSAAYNMGAALPQIYVKRVIQIYDLAPSIFPNATDETFCNVFQICKSPTIKTTTVMGMNESMTNKNFTETLNTGKPRTTRFSVYAVPGNFKNCYGPIDLQTPP